jgi:phosphohistidine phosphatase
MDLILWRHAEAEELPKGGQDAGDLERPLTSRGQKQAARMALWLERQLPERTRILVSPARRCEQTALVLGRKYKIRAELGPDGPPAQLLELVQWPVNKVPILVIGHQPTLGQTLSQLLGLREEDCAVRKGALWWIRARQREGGLQTVVVTVQSPDLL